jgi:hypothetical protein
VLGGRSCTQISGDEWSAVGFPSSCWFRKENQINLNEMFNISVDSNEFNDIVLIT